MKTHSPTISNPVLTPARAVSLNRFPHSKGKGEKSESLEENETWRKKRAMKKVKKKNETHPTRNLKENQFEYTTPEDAHHIITSFKQLSLFSFIILVITVGEYYISITRLVWSSIFVLNIVVIDRKCFVNFLLKRRIIINESQ